MATVEKNALAKVENVKKDHMQRLNVLAQEKVFPALTRIKISTQRNL